jgi:[Skp1-protein]-hydroxyproline N-acetylglucosaminyltransferase
MGATRYPLHGSETSSRATGSSSRKSGVDKPIAFALVALLFLYSTVTLATYYRVSASDHDALTTSATVSGTATTSFPSTLHAASVTQKVLVPKKQEGPIERLQRTFPIHVGKDVEEIPHSGLETVDVNPNQKGRDSPSNLPKTMMVPKFFEDSHGAAYGGSIRDYLGNGDELMSFEKTMKIGSSLDGLETIYCSIASYRDPECTLTVEDLFARAAHPDRIRVAILDQRVDGDSVCAQPVKPCNEDPSQALCKYRHLIDVFEMDARLAVGPVFARHLAHRHYRGEYFAMQIDSHVRFIEGWDDDIVQQWKSAKNEMAVLSTYVSDINGSIDPITHESTHENRPIMCASDYEGHGANKHLRHGQQPEGPAGIKGQPTLHPFWAAGFSFARGHFVIQIPYDQYLPMIFQGEEISIGLRGFTYGYDYYAPERGVMFHMYAVKDNEEKRKKVPLFWENLASYRGAGVRAMKRLNVIIGMASYPETEYNTKDMKKYGLGKVRTTAKFFKTFGIHTATQTVEDHLCRFVGKPMMKVFLPALRENGMGLDYKKIDYVFKDAWPSKKKEKKKV